MMLAAIKKFDAQDEQYSLMHQLYLNEDISDDQRCHINFGLAKACEDLGNYEQAYAHYGEGNALRKKLLKYDINVDVDLFKKIKSSYPKIVQNSLASESFPNNLTPIFIVGMPRSGTTLVEQIISSHSQVTGAGELNFDLALPLLPVSQKQIMSLCSIFDINILINSRMFLIEN